MSTKEKILQTALKLFASQGIENTSTNQITQDVGVASGTLFVHFKTKQELVDTLYVSIKKEAFSRLVAHSGKDQTVEIKLKQKVKLLIDYFLQNYEAFKFMELVDVSPVISDVALEAGKAEYQELVEQISQWREQKHLKQLNLELILATVWSLCTVLIKHCHQKKQGQVTDEQLQIVWSAVKY